MNNRINKSETGQAIVYLVLGLVVFFGFVALAIDGGMVLADRRNDQNAADAASLAGGGKAASNLQSGDIYKQNWNCGAVSYAMHNAEVAAVNRAEANNFPITYTVGVDHNYVDATCNSTGRYIDVTVEISATTQSNFLQIVYPDALHNEVEAVTRVFPGYPAGLGNAIVSLNDSPCSDPGSDGGIVYTNKGAAIKIDGGGVFSNGCLRQNGNITVVITDGLPLYHDEFNLDNDNWDPDPQSTDLVVNPSDFGIPFDVTCTDHYKKASDLEKDLQKGPVNLDPGLYCITGNLSISAGDKLSGSGVTILMVDGSLDINGKANITLSAPGENATKGIPGVLFYIPGPDNPSSSVCPTKQVISLNGTSTSTFTGMILAPCSTVTLNGTGGNTYVGQVVGWDVTVGGDADLDLTYQRNPLFDVPSSMELHR